MKLGTTLPSLAVSTFYCDRLVPMNNLAKIERFRRGRSFWLGSAGQFAPGDQFNFLLSQNLPKLVTGKEIVVALSPGCTPCGTLPGGCAKLVIVITGMNDELGHAGCQVFQRSQVKLRPFFG